MDKLPCKKCGYEQGRTVAYGHIGEPYRRTYRITCPNCSYCTKEKETRKEAADAWNQRNS